MGRPVPVTAADFRGGGFALRAGVKYYFSVYSYVRGPLGGETAILSPTCATASARAG